MSGMLTQSARRMMRADVYLTEKRLLVVSLAKTRDGFWVVDGELAMADAADVRPEVLGQLVLDALGRSRAGVAVPVGRSPTTVALIRSAGVASWGAFAKKARLVGVVREATDGEILITPTHRSRAAYFPLMAEQRSASAVPMHLGASVMTALAAAR